VPTDAHNPTASPSSYSELTPEHVHGIDRSGGTMLHTSRTNPSRMKAADLPAFVQRTSAAADGDVVDVTEHVLSVFEALKIDVLIAIGGDDTLSYAARIHTEGMKVICIPKTMDNDVFGTDYCIGFSTCVTRSVEMINRLRTAAGSHERLHVVELFGRNCGLTALAAGFLADADRTLIAEVPFSLERLARFMSDDRAESSSNYAVAVWKELIGYAEGACWLRCDELLAGAVTSD
jgi:6-phosphofructokinase 1